MGNSKYSSGQFIKWVDYVILAAICVFCFRYILQTGKAFAQTSVMLPSMNFPIFIGEFLLAGCFTLFALRTGLAVNRISKGLYALLFFLGFILTKAFLGYVDWGPLALRDAAMFYYSLFAVITYTVYRPDFFQRWVIWAGITAIFWLVYDTKYNEYWMMPRLFLGCALAWKVDNRWWKWIFITAIVVTTPFHYFLDASRSIIVGNFLSIVVLIIGSVWIVEAKRRKAAIALGTVAIVLLASYVFFFSGNKQARGLFAFDKLATVYKEAYDCILEKRAKFKPRQIEKIAIYNKDIDYSKDVVDNKTVVDKRSVGEAKTKVSAPQTKEAPAVVTVARPLNPLFDPKTKGEALLTTQMKLGNTVFRLLIWEDAKRELLDKKPLVGFDFGKPFRSENIEIVRWGMDHWARDGWIGMHNSYLNIVYRAGLIGIVLVAGLWAYTVRCFLIFIRMKSLVGILICSALMIPFTAANFSLAFEVPYTAIPFWSLYGLMMAYANNQLEKSRRVTG